VDEFPPEYKGKVMVKVSACDWRRTSLILDELLPDRRRKDPADDGDKSGRCLKCQSPDIIFRSSDPERDPDLPVDSTYAWYCETCGHHWSDDPNEWDETEGL